MSNGWQRVGAPDLPPHLVAAGTQGFVKGDCRVLLTRREPYRNSRGELRYRQHLSVSCASRYPTWDEIKDARYSLMGMGINVAMFLPPLDQYVNIHANCFHLYEVQETPG